MPVRTWQSKKGKREKDNARRTLYRAQGGRCIYCGKATWLVKRRLGESPQPDDFTLDHFEPRSLGEHTDARTNLVGACYECNQRKANLTAEQFIPKQRLPEVLARLSAALANPLLEPTHALYGTLRDLAHRAAKENSAARIAQAQADFRTGQGLAELLGMRLWQHAADRYTLRMLKDGKLGKKPLWVLELLPGEQVVKRDNRIADLRLPVPWTLPDVIQAALEMECSFVRFDRQGVTVDALPGMRPVEVARRWREGAEQERGA